MLGCLENNISNQIVSIKAFVFKRFNLFFTFSVLFYFLYFLSIFFFIFFLLLFCFSFYIGLIKSLLDKHKHDIDYVAIINSATKSVSNYKVTAPFTIMYNLTGYVSY